MPRLSADQWETVRAEREAGASLTSWEGTKNGTSRSSKKAFRELPEGG